VIAYSFLPFAEEESEADVADIIVSMPPCGLIGPQVTPPSSSSEAL